MDTSARTILRMIEEELAAEPQHGIVDPSRAVDAARALVRGLAAQTAIRPVVIRDRRSEPDER